MDVRSSPPEAAAPLETAADPALHRSPGPRHRQGHQQFRAALKPLARQLISLMFPADCLGCGRLDWILCPVCSRRLRKLTQKPYRAERDSPLLAETMPGTVPGLSHGLLVYAAGPYRDELARVILAYKKLPAAALRRPLAGALARAIALAQAEYETRQGKISAGALKDAAETWFLVPVPSSAAGFRRRGFEPVRSLLTAWSALAAWSSLTAWIAGLPGLGRNCRICSGRRVRVSPMLRRTLRFPASQQKKEQKTALRRDRESRVRGSLRLSRIRRRHLSARYLLIDDVLTTGATLREAAEVLRSGGYPVDAAVVLAAVAPGQDESCDRGVAGPS